MGILPQEWKSKWTRTSNMKIGTGASEGLQGLNGFGGSERLRAWLRGFEAQDLGVGAWGFRCIMAPRFPLNYGCLEIIRLN